MRAFISWRGVYMAFGDPPPTLMSILYDKLHWAQTSTGWVDPAHPSERGLDKYKEFAWDAMGRADCLSIKILDGWNFTESTNTKKGTCSFESNARQIRMRFATTCVGHAIDVLEMMVQHPKRCVPLSMKVMVREIAPRGPNLAAERNRPLARGVVEWEKRPVGKLMRKQEAES